MNLPTDMFQDPQKHLIYYIFKEPPEALLHKSTPKKLSIARFNLYQVTMT